MNEKGKQNRNVRWLFAIRRYITFFLLMAFVISCCMTLFLNMMTRSTGLSFTKEHIEQAAKVTFLNVIGLSLLCTVIDGIRRKFMVDQPTFLYEFHPFTRLAIQMVLTLLQIT